MVWFEKIRCWRKTEILWVTRGVIGGAGWVYGHYGPPNDCKMNCFAQLHKLKAAKPCNCKMSRLLDFSSLEMHQNHIFRSFAPDPTVWAYSTAPDPLAGGKGGLLPLTKNITPSPLSARRVGPQTSAFRASFHRAVWLDPPITDWNDASVMDSLITIAFYYRAMLCIPVLATGLCLCLSVSVTSRSSTKTAKRRITQRTPHNSPGNLVFWCPRCLRNSTRVTPYGGAKCRWVGSKSATFDK